MILKKVMKKLPGLLALLGMTIFVFLGVISCLSTRRMYTGSESLYWKWDHVLGKLLFGGVLIMLWLLIGKAESWLTDRRMFLAAILVSCMVIVSRSHGEPGVNRMQTSGMFMWRRRGCSGKIIRICRIMYIIWCFRISWGWRSCMLQ